MKTQISRNSFSPSQRYSGVYQQMGRMITDADWNELSELVKFQLLDSLRDVIGSGSPRERGMVIPTGPGSYALRWGHLYVDGIHGKAVPNPNVFTPAFQFAEQADFPAAPVLSAGEYRLYADVWERTVTPLEDPALIDPGLKGADTCTRTLTMTQIKACDTAISIADIQDNEALNPSIGNIAMNAQIRQGQTVKDPCDPCADELALQESVGNYLFRIEVHDVEWSAGATPEITAIVFKWSSENGAEQYVAGNTPPGFESSKWCYEFFSGPDDDPSLNMTTEKHLGHHLFNGFTPTHGQLFDGYPATEPAGLPLVRRWDGFMRLQRAGGSWSLDTGADRGRAISNSYSDTDHAFIDLSGPISINLNSLVVSFDLSDPIALAGDYWQAAVRQAIHSAGSKLLENVPPTGIKHHYFVLGRAQVNGAGEITDFIPERGDICTPFDFPSLTDIRARDVCYNNDCCDMPDVRTVQDAIDYLCRERDLRWHNKHLHGMGVVCGLRVQCGPDTLPTEEGDEPTRRLVTVTDGYAISCEGDDMVMEIPRNKDIIAAIAELEEETGEKILDENGNASVSLYIELDGSGEPALKISTKESASKTDSWLDGTIWMDFYQHCIKDLLEEIREELGQLNINDIDAAEAENGELISIQRKKLVTLVNLIAYLFYQPHGRYVFTSYKEHVILRDFYLRLRELLQSKTFCGMYKGQDFPDYPFEQDIGYTTWFGKNHHERLAVHPGGRLVFSYQGADTTINIYDSQKGTLAAVTEVPSGQGGSVTALTFSNDGKLVFAAVDINGTDSILSRGRIEDAGVAWETSAVLCNVRVADLRFDPKADDTLYLVGYYEGLYVLDAGAIFNEEKVVPAPSYTFNAVGQVAYDFNSGVLFATAASEDNEKPLYYDRIAVVSLEQAVANSNGSPVTARTFPLLGPDGNRAIGEDDIAVSQANENGANEFYVVINGRSGNKSLVLYNSPHGDEAPKPASSYNQLPDTEIRLAYHDTLQRLVLSLEDEFRLQLFEQTRLVIDRIPVQLLPSDVVVNRKTGAVYALNYAGNTVTAIEQNQLNVTDAFNQQLSDYRYAVLLAFMALFGNLLQNLKDCFCNLLLIKCPDCTEDEKVWLASIAVQDNEVYKICNIGKRKELWTLPKVGYWMSIVPILPMIRKAISGVCCSIIPNIFAERLQKYEQREDPVAPVRGKTYKQAVKKSKRTDTKMLLRENTKDVALTSKIAGDRILYDQSIAQRGVVSKQQYRNLHTGEAVQQMEQNGLQVEVKQYRADEASEALQKFQGTPKSIPAGSRVTVYQDKGRVLFYAAEPVEQAAVVLDDSKLKQLEARKQALANMDDVNASIARAESRKQAVEELATVQNRLTDLNSERAKAQEDVAALKEQLNSLQTERDKTLKEMQSMQEGMTVLHTNLQEMKVEIDKQRPLKEIASVDTESQVLLKQEGILTVNDLANADAVKLAESGVDTNKAKLMISDARNKLGLLK